MDMLLDLLEWTVSILLAHGIHAFKCPTTALEWKSKARYEVVKRNRQEPMECVGT